MDEAIIEKLTVYQPVKKLLNFYKQMCSGYHGGCFVALLHGTVIKISRRFGEALTTTGSGDPKGDRHQIVERNASLASSQKLATGPYGKPAGYSPHSHISFKIKF
jgi:hypothetical protein